MKSFNRVEAKGRLHNYVLNPQVTEKGEAISGTVQVEVDAEGTIVEGRFFTYPTYNNGKTNKTHVVLEEMMAGKWSTVTEDGPDADWIDMTGSIDVSYFVGRNNNNNNSDDDLVRSQKVRGAFLNANNTKTYANKWKLDMLITTIRDIDADEEKQLPRFVRVAGYLIDDYRKLVKEVVFQARAEKAMDYISGLPASHEAPYFVAVWGQLTKVGRTVVRKNAFGDDETDVYESVQWVITGMNPDMYDFGDEAAISTEDYTAFKAALDVHKQEQRDRDNDGGGEVGNGTHSAANANLAF